MLVRYNSFISITQDGYQIAVVFEPRSVHFDVYMYIRIILVFIPYQDLPDIRICSSIDLPSDSTTLQIPTCP